MIKNFDAKDKRAKRRNLRMGDRGASIFLSRETDITQNNADETAQTIEIHDQKASKRYFNVHKKK